MSITLRRTRKFLGALVVLPKSVFVLLAAWFVVIFTAAFIRHPLQAFLELAIGGVIAVALGRLTWQMHRTTDDTPKELTPSEYRRTFPVWLVIVVVLALTHDALGLFHVISW